jgi:protein-disulfide isomerase
MVAGGIFILAIAAALASLLLFGVQLFVLHAVCPMCVISAVIVFLLLVVSYRLKAESARSGTLPEAFLLTVLAVGSIVLTAVTRGGNGKTSSVLAVVDGQPILEEDLRSQMALTLQPVEKKLFEFQSAWLEQQIARRILRSAAVQQETTVEHLIKTRVDDLLHVTDAEVDAWLLARGMPPEKAQPELRTQARREALITSRQRLYDQLVASLRGNHQIQILLKRPSYPVLYFGPGHLPLLGSEQAAVKLVVFSDFQCPYCARLAPELKQVHERHPTDVSIEFRHLSVPGHEHGQMAAEAAECAASAGRFWAYHDLLFSLGANLENLDVAALAKKVGLEPETFQRCLESRQGKSAVLADYAEAEKLGIQGAPALFLNGRRVGGFLESSEMEQLLEEELKKPR